jgi:hypothetical protein
MNGSSKSVHPFGISFFEFNLSPNCIHAHFLSRWGLVYNNGGNEPTFISLGGKGDFCTKV